MYKFIKYIKLDIYGIIILLNFYQT